MKYNKIFGIGLPKTGTSSLAKAISILGYRVLHNPYEWRKNIYDKGLYQAPNDNWDVVCNFGEWNYPQFDRLYPGSCFILTLRPKDLWLETCKKWFGKTPGNENVRIDIFGTKVFSTEQFCFIYKEHYKTAIEYFSKRKDFLIFQEPFKWEPLCFFLEKPVPKMLYPWENKTI